MDDSVVRAGSAIHHMPDSYTVYVLQDDEGKLYKGMTSNVERRLAEHRAGKVRTTSRMANINVVYTETCSSRKAARIREKYLKSAAGRRFLEKVLRGN